MSPYHVIAALVCQEFENASEISYHPRDNPQYSVLVEAADPLKCTHK